MMYRFYFIAFLIISSQWSYAQSSGLLFNDSLYNQIPKISELLNSKALLPAAVSYRKFCPKPADQKKPSSCVGWSAAYGVYTVSQAIKANISRKKMISKNAYSAMFVYNQLNNGNCSMGITISDACELMKNKGLILSADFDKPVNDCEKKPDSTLLQKARQYQLKDYLILFNTRDGDSVKIRKAKESLAAGKPLLIGMKITADFKKLTKQNPVWQPKEPLRNVEGHAMTLIGYNDEKQAFEVMNSWGTKWGSNGFGWIRYSDFGKYCQYACQLIIHPDAPGLNKPYNVEIVEPVHLSAISNLKFPTRVENNQYKFIDVRTEHKGNGIYRLINSKWEKGDSCQLRLSGIPADSYVYVFSLDSEFNVPVHWPRNASLSKLFKDKNEGAIVPYSGDGAYSA